MTSRTKCRFNSKLAFFYQTIVVDESWILKLFIIIIILYIIYIITNY